MRVFSTSLAVVCTDSELYSRASRPVFGVVGWCFTIGNKKDYSDNCHTTKLEVMDPLKMSAKHDDSDADSMMQVYWSLYLKHSWVTEAMD
jgi:hypothetical protein